MSIYSRKMGGKKIRIVETFTGIQGESTYAGLLCFFIRLAGCNLKCSYCDTMYAGKPSSGFDSSVNLLLLLAKFAGIPLVEITGGEPLLQKAVPELCGRLLKNGFKVLIETNGSLPVSVLPKGVIRIIDCKCPASGEAGKMSFANFAELVSDDEVKFVIANRADFEYAVSVIEKYDLPSKTENLLFSPAFGKIKAAKLAEWMIAAKPPARLQLQIQKHIWHHKIRGV